MRCPCSPQGRVPASPASSARRNVAVNTRSKRGFPTVVGVWREENGRGSTPLRFHRKLPEASLPSCGKTESCCGDCGRRGDGFCGCRHRARVRRLAELPRTLVASRSSGGWPRGKSEPVCLRARRRKSPDLATLPARPLGRITGRETSACGSAQPDPTSSNAARLRAEPPGVFDTTS